MGILVYLLSYISLKTYQLLMLQIIVGIVVYLGLAKLFKIESFKYLYKTVIDLIKKRSDKNDK